MWGGGGGSIGVSVGLGECGWVCTCGWGLTTISLISDLLTLCVLSLSYIQHLCFLDHEGDLLNLALVHYTFENEEHAIMPRPHGNSKSQSAYVYEHCQAHCRNSVK